MSFIEKIIYSPGVRHILGLAANHVAYFAAEKIKKRSITRYVRDIRNFDRLSPEARAATQKKRLLELLNFASVHVPYYRDIFRENSISIEKIGADLSFMQDIPFLTKDIIREQGERLLSRSLNSGPYFPCKTGGSTGPACVIYYDREATDRSAAVTRFSRLRLGKNYHRSELHFACDFGEPRIRNFWQRETLKCAAMNRSNIFFSEIDDYGLGKIYNALRQRHPYLVHGHPSTLYQLALYVEEKGLAAPVFEIFEPSGEVCDPKKCEKIQKVFGCRIHNRYGLAEFGVVAYQFGCSSEMLQVFTSDVFCETRADEEANELVVTGFHNRLMPLIRYRTGDLVDSLKQSNHQHIRGLMGRIHEKVELGERALMTHYIQDVIDHRIGGVAEFQVVDQDGQITFLIKEEQEADQPRLRECFQNYFPEASELKFVGSDAFIRVGQRQKFKHVVRL